MYLSPLPTVKLQSVEDNDPEPPEPQIDDETTARKSRKHKGQGDKNLDVIYETDSDVEYSSINSMSEYSGSLRTSFKIPGLMTSLPDSNSGNVNDSIDCDVTEEHVFEEEE